MVGTLRNKTIYHYIHTGVLLLPIIVHRYVTARGGTFTSRLFGNGWKRSLNSMVMGWRSVTHVVPSSLLNTALNQQTSMKIVHYCAYDVPDVECGWDWLLGVKRQYQNFCCWNYELYCIDHVQLLTIYNTSYWPEVVRVPLPSTQREGM